MSAPAPPATAVTTAQHSRHAHPPPAKTEDSVPTPTAFPNSHASAAHSTTAPLAAPTNRALQIRAATAAPVQQI